MSGLNYFVPHARRALMQNMPAAKPAATLLMQLWADGVCTGLTAHATWENGTQVCGTMSTPLKEQCQKVHDAVAQVMAERYSPPKP